MSEVPPLCQCCSFADGKDKNVIFSFKYCTVVYIGKVQPLPWIYLDKALTCQTTACLLAFPHDLCCSHGFGSHSRAELEFSRVKQWVQTAPVQEAGSVGEAVRAHMFCVCWRMGFNSNAGLSCRHTGCLWPVRAAPSGLKQCRSLSESTLWSCPAGAAFICSERRAAVRLCGVVWGAAARHALT